MKPRAKLIIAGTAVVLAAGIGTYAFTASSQERRPFDPPFMHRMGSGMMGMNHDPATTAELRVIHELLINHDQIRRTVTNLPDGIRTVTESDDPRIAELIKDHVASMDRRVATGSDPGLPIESPALHAIFRDKDKIRTTTEKTENGIVVVQTSSDPNVVATLQQHASEVSDLVRGGMTAVRPAMMRSDRGMMHGGRGGPCGATEWGRIWNRPGLRTKSDPGAFNRPGTPRRRH